MSQYHITNAKIVTSDAVIHGSVIINDEKIEGIIPAEKYNPESFIVKNTDVNGAYVLPGIIDIHTDAIENEIMPRSRADFPIEVAFRELEKKMSACGITTVYHSMHLGYQKAENQLSSKFSRQEVFERVFNCLNRPSAIRNKIHLRYELSGIYHYELVEAYLQNGNIELFSIMDHTPGQGQYSLQEVIKRYAKDGKTEQEVLEIVKTEQAKPKVKGSKLENLITIAKSNNIPIASHDDDSPEKVKQMYDMGISICEFPITLPAAAKAVELGMHTIGGGANVLRGGSTSGNMNVQEAIAKGLIDSLCSDYYPPSILHSIFKLFHEGTTSLPNAVNIASLNPARAVKLDHSLGSIAPGKKADLIVVELRDGLPEVISTIVNGKEVYSGQLAVNKKQKVLCQ